MTPIQQSALRVALALEYPAFPCRENKIPACPHGFKDAATADRGLATIWARYPGELVGVPTGKASGFSVLDIDAGGGEWWAANKARLPQTRLHRTRSGGLHALFKHRSGLKCSAGRIGLGVDVRADGGYIIWWPAIGLKEQSAALADWPDWLAPKPAEHQSNVRPFQSQDPPRERSIDAKLRGIARCVEQSREGERNAVLFWAACRVGELLRDGALPPHAGESFCVDVLRIVAGRAGLPDWETQRTIASGFRSARHG